MKPSQITLSVLGFICLVVLLMAGCPAYRVYTAKMEGEAKLAHARYSKQVMVQEAIAKDSSAIFEAAADTTHAHGVAWSNEIIGRSLINNPKYLEYLWINEINHNNNVMYIATEAGLPIIEAGRLGQIQSKKEAEVKPTE